MAALILRLSIWDSSRNGGARDTKDPRAGYGARIVPYLFGEGNSVTAGRVRIARPLVRTGHRRVLLEHLVERFLDNLRVLLRLAAHRVARRAAPGEPLRV